MVLSFKLGLQEEQSINEPMSQIKMIQNICAGTQGKREGFMGSFLVWFCCFRALFLEVLLYWARVQSEQHKLLFLLPALKIHLLHCPQIEDVLDLKRIRTDISLDLSLKAEK